MATLQTSRQGSAFTARSRLKQQATRDRFAQTYPSNEPPVGEEIETVSTSFVNMMDHALAGTYRQRLSPLEQHQLLLQTVKVYDHWNLISVQHHPENEALVAHLMDCEDCGDPTLAIREGRTMQIIMDAVGDMKVQYARRRRSSMFRRWWNRLSV